MQKMDNKLINKLKEGKWLLSGVRTIEMRLGLGVLLIYDKFLIRSSGGSRIQKHG